MKVEICHLHHSPAESIFLWAYVCVYSRDRKWDYTSPPYLVKFRGLVKILHNGFHQLRPNRGGGVAAPFVVHSLIAEARRSTFLEVGHRADPSHPAPGRPGPDPAVRRGGVSVVFYVFSFKKTVSKISFSTEKKMPPLSPRYVTQLLGPPSPFL